MWYKFELKVFMKGVLFLFEKDKKCKCFIKVCLS